MAENENELSDQQLIMRWETEEGQKFREEIIRQLQAEETGHAVDWENLTVVVGGEEKLWRDFPGVVVVRNMLREDFVDNKVIQKTVGLTAAKNAYWADLRYINLEQIKIPRAHLSFAHLQNSKLFHAKLQNAQLLNTNFEYADLDFAELQEAKLFDTNLQKANLTYTNLENADILFSYVESTNLSHAILIDADLNHAKFRLKSFWWRTGLIRIPEKLGKNIDRHRPTILTGADLTGIKLGSSPTMHRKLLDEVYLEDFAEHHPVFYQLWLWTSNCGRSPLLVGLWAALIGIFFGFAFAYYPYPAFLPDWAWLQDIFIVDQPMFDFTGNEWWRPYYHSFTTLTTLGWGSAEPNSTTGAGWHTAENIVGYAALGYLIAVIGDLLTRRSA